MSSRRPWNSSRLLLEIELQQCLVGLFVFVMQFSGEHGVDFSLEDFAFLFQRLHQVVALQEPLFELVMHHLVQSAFDVSVLLLVLQDQAEQVVFLVN